MVVIVRTVHVSVTAQLHLRLFNSCLNHSHDEVSLSLHNRWKCEFRVGELDNELLWFKSINNPLDCWEVVASTYVVFVSVLNDVFDEIQLNHALLISFQHGKYHKRKEVGIPDAGSHTDVLRSQTTQSERIEVFGALLFNWKQLESG